MKKYFSPSTGGFYSEDIHGPKMLSVLEPSFVIPMREIPDPDWVPDPDIGGEPPMIEIVDNSSPFPHIEVPNPDCLMPSDAIEISAERHAELMAEQGLGKRIIASEDGSPVAVDQLPPTDEGIRRVRDGMLAASDWTQLADVPAATKNAWKGYRQALRDVPDQAGFPESVNWPTSPA